MASIYGVRVKSSGSRLKRRISNDFTLTPDITGTEFNSVPMSDNA